MAWHVMKQAVSMQASGGTVRRIHGFGTLIVLCVDSRCAKATRAVRRYDMSAAGIDYGRGLANVDTDTGVRYGVISVHSLGDWVVGEANLSILRRRRLSVHGARLSSKLGSPVAAMSRPVLAVCMRLMSLRWTRWNPSTGTTRLVMHGM